ncbi:hypothetical protein [Edaphobacter bradus]|uniref:hypothetical protein n=1 Tax=Edaphobacter bradus TaxID=2259016 RepID=UPI0021DFD216|nr:hypothetical protein [Edaphobacter bradus]
MLRQLFNERAGGASAEAVETRFGAGRARRFAVIAGLFCCCFGCRGFGCCGRGFRLVVLFVGEVGGGDLEAVENEPGAAGVDVVGGKAAEDLAKGGLDGGSAGG